MTATKTTAADKYAANQADAAELIDELQAALQSHMDATNPESVNWGHVGDIGHVIDILNQAIAAL
jgi:hypothetical protein